MPLRLLVFLAWPSLDTELPRAVLALIYEFLRLSPILSLTTELLI